MKPVTTTKAAASLCCWILNTKKAAPLREATAVASVIRLVSVAVVLVAAAKAATTVATATTTATAPVA